MTVERWYDAYDNDPLVYEKFSHCEDFEGKVLDTILFQLPVKDARILDIGCGTGKYVKSLAPFASSYYALDKSADMLHVAKAKCQDLSNVSFLNCNSCSIPLPNSSIDLVLSTWGLGSRVIEETMAEVSRIIKPGGEMWFITNLPECDFMNMRGAAAIDKDRNYMNRLKNEYGFEQLIVVNTEFIFPSIEEMKYLIKYFFGQATQEYIDKRNSTRINHSVLFLKKKF